MQPVFIKFCLQIPQSDVQTMETQHQNYIMTVAIIKMFSASTQYIWLVHPLRIL